LTVDEPADVELDEPLWRLSWWQVVVLVVAFAFLAGAAVHYWDTRPEPAGSVDAGFYADMVFHHQQAVEMSVLELANGADPTVRGYARDILTFQQYEIGRMDEQLRQWGLAPRGPGEMAMAWMHDPVPVSSMPGLATDEQLAALRAARGQDADSLFLELMAAHHRAGAHMASYAAESAHDAGVRDLAARMAHNQATEINEFAQTAARLGFDIEIAPA
jgi:uncharacterized protein (DUF305 family)